jgi:hypothetical protein
MVCDSLSLGPQEEDFMDKDTKTLRRMMRDEPDIANFVDSAVRHMADEILRTRGVAHGMDYGPHWVGFAARIKAELARNELSEAA